MSSMNWSSGGAGTRPTYSIDAVCGRCAGADCASPAGPSGVLAAALFGLQPERLEQLAQALVALPLLERARQLN